MFISDIDIKIIRIFSLLTALFVSLYGVQTENIYPKNNYYQSYNEALQKAKNENKPLILIMVAKNCKWCKKFQSVTLADKNIATKIDKSFIAVIVDKDSDRKNYPNKFYPSMVPTIYFINPNNENIFYKDVGYIDVNDYSSELDTALTKFKKLN